MEQTSENAEGPVADGLADRLSSWIAALRDDTSLDRAASIQRILEWYQEGKRSNSIRRTVSENILVILEATADDGIDTLRILDICGDLIPTLATDDKRDVLSFILSRAFLSGSDAFIAKAGSIFNKSYTFKVNYPAWKNSPSLSQYTLALRRFAELIELNGNFTDVFFLVDSLIESNEFLTDWYAYKNLLCVTPLRFNSKFPPMTEEHVTKIVVLMLTCIQRVTQAFRPSNKPPLTEGYHELEKSWWELSSYFCCHFSHLLGKLSRNRECLVMLMFLPRYFCPSFILESQVICMKLITFIRRTAEENGSDTRLCDICYGTIDFLSS